MTQGLLQRGASGPPPLRPRAVAWMSGTWMSGTWSVDERHIIHADVRGATRRLSHSHSGTSTREGKATTRVAAIGERLIDR